MIPLKHFAGAALAILAIVGAPHALAQAYPAKSVRVIVPYPPGGVLDGLVRGVSQRLQDSLGQPFVVENRPGANGNIGLDACAKSPPDGHTLCMTTNDSISINAFLYSKLPFDAARDLAPVAPLAWANGVFVAHPSVGASNLRELLALGRQKPGNLTWGTWGNGSTSHLYLAWMNSRTQAQITHVPYKGAAPLLQALLSGEVSSGFLASGILMPHIKAGKLKPLAVMGAKRLPSLPEVGTLPENGIDFYVRTWFGTFAPTGTPASIIERLNAEITRSMSDPQFLEKFLTPAGFEPAIMTPSQFGEFLKGDREAGATLVRAANVTLD